MSQQASELQILLVVKRVVIMTGVIRHELWRVGVSTAVSECTFMNISACLRTNE